MKISLKAARVNANMTILEAAEKLGIGKDSLINWEKEPWNISALYQRKISEVYGLPIDMINFFPTNIEFNSINDSNDQKERRIEMEGKEERVTLKMLVELIRKLDNEQRKKLYYLLLGNELREDQIESMYFLMAWRSSWERSRQAIRIF